MQPSFFNLTKPLILMTSLKEMSFIIAVTFIAFNAVAQQPETILLKNYRPKSIYKIPVTDIKRAKFPVCRYFSTLCRSSTNTEVYENLF